MAMENKLKTLQLTESEVHTIHAALVMQAKSYQRLAAREGQPPEVANEYRKQMASLTQLNNKVIAA